jgi:hypothetical protein
MIELVQIDDFKKPVKTAQIYFMFFSSNCKEAQSRKMVKLLQQRMEFPHFLYSETISQKDTRVI